MACTFENRLIEKTIEFHGHTCPGLAIGIRAAELAIERLKPTDPHALTCVTETDMCGVDAIQFLTGCTFGKGNLVHLDYGKSAFTFFDREREKGFRAVFRDDAADRDMTREERTDRIMAADLTELFVTADVAAPPVRPPSILSSIRCHSCGEMTMESRIRLFGGKSYCIPCFGKVEQKR